MSRSTGSDFRRIECVDDAMADVLRVKSGADRLRIANGMFLSARQLVEGSVRRDHPDWDDRQVKVELARRFSHGSI